MWEVRTQRSLFKAQVGYGSHYIEFQETANQYFYRQSVYQLLFT